MEEDDLRNMQAFIVNKTRASWDEHQKPYMLAEVAPDLKHQGMNYKEIIFPETLKRFIENTLSGDVKVVTHPTQRTKIALVPTGISYEFDAPRQTRLTFADHFQTKTAVSVPPRVALLQFLEALTLFNPDEVDQVVIPTSLLIRMVREQ